ncbi:MAG TPA: hypothetical protein VK154_04240 [Chitinophagales bacterium]|nr:hypothetical protein [Chitinophagales bacterium]
MDKEFKQAVTEFLEAFEEVFDKDWDYTKEQLGAWAETEQQRQERLKNPDDGIYPIHPEGTFINPRTEDEFSDWGYRGNLLEKYRQLKRIIHST